MADMMCGIGHCPQKTAACPSAQHLLLNAPQYNFEVSGPEEESVSIMETITRYCMHQAIRYNNKNVENSTWENITESDMLSISITTTYNLT